MMIFACFLTILLTTNSGLFSEEYEIKPSGWGTDKWYGGYEVYKKDKYGNENMVGEIKPSVWGTTNWTGGYELIRKNKYGTDEKAGEVRPSVWGTTNWTGGYKIKLDDKKMTKSEEQSFRETLEKLLDK